MGDKLTCPNCGATELDLHDFDSMIVVTPRSALFTVVCPHCATRVSSLRLIPPDMQDAVQYAAIEVGAGMGKDR